MKQCVKIHVMGKVQGVGYRSYVQKYAQKLAIEGFVQNLDDGAVTILACGTSDKLDQFIDEVYKGSASTKVQDVAVEPVMQIKDFRGVFRIIE